MKQFYVRENEAGQRLDKLLLKLLNNAPKSFIYKMLRKKNIVLNGKKAQGSEKLQINDEIKLFLSDETIALFTDAVDATPVEYSLDVVYEDRHILIANKPFGVLSQKAADSDISMVEYIISYLLKTNQITSKQLATFKPGICNRLDRNTSGLLIAGKSLFGLQAMSGIIKDRSLQKYYLCIVSGRLEGRKRIEGYLYKDEVRNIVTVTEKQLPDTDYICTEYEPLSNSVAIPQKEFMKSAPVSREPHTLLKVKLVTGRSHQIRAHLASIGHPVIGDFKYGNSRVNEYYKEAYGLTHQLLHSYKIVFPKLTEELAYLSGKEFTAPEPELFQRIKRDLFD